MSVKYRQYYSNMIAQNSELFAAFRLAHDGFVAGKLSQDKFNERGMKVVDVIRDWERRLCSAMGKGQFSKFSEKLSEKFWSEVRKNYSHIDMVGVKVKQERLI